MHHLRFRFPRLCRFAAFLTLVAMLIPVGTNLVHYTSHSQAFIRICGVEQNSDGGQSKVPSHKLPSCPICQSLHLLGFGFVPAVSPVIIMAFLATPLYVSRERIFLLDHTIAYQARPRAPPVSL